MYIRKAESVRDFEAVWRLTHDAYVKQGYCSPQPEGMLKHYLHLDTIPETSVFMAFDENDRLVGTNSLTLDNPAGLNVDDDFKDRADQVRVECLRTRKKMGAAWRIVTDETVHNQISIMLGLISATIDQGMRQCLDVLLFIFNPKHVRFYEQMLGLKVIAEPRFGKSVKSAPAVLMRGDRTEVLNAWERTCSRRKSTRIPEYMSTTISTRAQSAGADIGIPIRIIAAIRHLISGIFGRVRAKVVKTVKARPVTAGQVATVQFRVGCR